MKQKTISSITLYSYFRCRRLQRSMKSALVCASAHAARLLRSAPHFAFWLLPNRIAAEMTPAARCSNRAPKTCLHSLEINLIIGAKYFVDRVDELLRLCVRRNAELVAHNSEKRGVGERRQFLTTTAEKRAQFSSSIICVFTAESKAITQNASRRTARILLNRIYSFD